MSDHITTNTRPRPVDLLWHRLLKRPYRLYLKDHGGGQSDLPVMIMLHGLASSSANWDPLIPLLKEKYRCITIDLIGFGASPKPDWYGYTMEEHIRNVNKTIDGLKIKKPFILVGHSLGSLIATRYATKNPKDVSRLVLLSPPVYAPLDTIESRIAQQRTSMYLKAYRYLRTNPRITFDSFLRLTRILPQTKGLVMDRATWIPLIRSLEQCIENQTIIRDIEQVTAPVDIFFGVFDEVVVSYNVKNLAKIREVTLHPLKVTHLVGKRYAAAVAKVLLGEEPVNKQAKRLPRRAQKPAIRPVHPES